MGRVTVIGLVGGVGSGKSTVAGLFRELGAVVLDADRIAHDCLDSPQLRDQVVTEFGAGVLDPAGRIDRSRLARVVFQDADCLRRLEQLVHPPVQAAIRARLSELADQAGDQLAILDAPLLLESELHQDCDRIVFVESSREARLDRVQRHRGWSDEELDRREKSQLPIKVKRERAQDTIRNDGPLDAVRARVRAIYQELKPKPRP